MTEKIAPRQLTVSYKTYITLEAADWDRLRAEAARRKVTGRVLIEQILGTYAYKLPAAEMPVTAVGATVVDDDFIWTDLQTRGDA